MEEEEELTANECREKGRDYRLCTCESLFSPSVVVAVVVYVSPSCRLKFSLVVILGQGSRIRLVSL